ncbi:type II toxin-antitoxin system HipA family toxin [Fodinicurvata sediminis]|uniref:type II toxin-antitoxin system HipA family toxin n=1 Tax=Fodinicurvata sediminis TaxID=1121832 RepID=UPI0003B4AF59|nr:HipA domain-containing protein [Fodinicurvata sediminis]
MNERRKHEPSALVVYLYGRRVGIITRLAGERNLFAFDEDYIEDPERSTLSLSFKTPSDGVVTEIRPVNTRVPPFFSNLLPEGHLREYLSARAEVNPEREFFLLNALGTDLPGAVTIAPTDVEAARGGHGQVEATAYKQAAHTMRFSLAGVQLKFSAIMEAAGGLTVPANGTGGSWIVKLPSARFPAVPVNEFVMMELARRIGIPVPEVKLIPLSEIAGLPADIGDMEGHALAVERFDRLPDGRRIHIEDFAQVFGLFPERKYERRNYANIAAVLWAEAGGEAVNDFLRRLVFSVLIGNADMHLKNWSLMYADGRTPTLSPAYDFVATLPYLPNDKLALSFGGSKDIHGISQEQIRRFADRAGLAVSPLWRLVEETVQETMETWREHSAKDLLPDRLRSSIDTHLQTVAKSVEPTARG